MTLLLLRITEAQSGLREFVHRGADRRQELGSDEHHDVGVGRNGP